jgi:hypothetical protein
MEYFGDRGFELAQMVNATCDFVDMENLVCRYAEAGLTPGGYEDSICSICLAALEQLRNRGMARKFNMR